MSTSGENHFGINVGRFKSADSAERILLKMQLVESATLAGSLRKVSEKGGGYDANFLGLSQEAAELACRRFAARSIPCLTLAP
jgi:D-alanyl-D-alanine carboxypeptidase